MNTEANIALKTELEDLKVEFEEISPLLTDIENREIFVNQRIADIDSKIGNINTELDELNKDIERLTFSGDTYDLMLATACGVFTGIIDAIFVGELGLFINAGDASKEHFEETMGDVHKSFNEFIMNYAKKKGYEGKSLKGAIAFLEDKFPVAQDNIWSGNHISSAKSHHLDDLAHHPSLVGLLAAILVEYLGLAAFSSKDGSFHVLFVKPNKEALIKLLGAIIISGFIKWLINLVERKTHEYDIDLPKPIQMLIEKLYLAPVALTILKSLSNWAGHLVSDMGGSKNTPGGGMGIPGLFLSLLKEISALPILKDSNLPKVVNDLYLKTKDSPLTHKLDLRTEMAVVKEQAAPIIINEVLVRSIFFIRHLINETTDKKINEIDWTKVVPFYNRTIVRMMTVASGTFTAVDVIDAAAETALKHPEACSSIPSFVGCMLMRINFVGIGRFAIAITTDVAMGIKKVRKQEERAAITQQMLLYTEAKLFYRCADSSLKMSEIKVQEKNMYDEEGAMWIQVGNTADNFCNLYQIAHSVGVYYVKTINEINSSFNVIEKDIVDLKETNPDFIAALCKRLD